MKIDLISATRESFSDFVGQRFDVQTESNSLSLLLDNVKIFQGSTVRDNHIEIDGVFYPPRKAFALTWEGPREPILASGIYSVTHPETGKLELAGLI
ncbi:DUF6916 family protein [Nioella aestuarii]|uniref:DUF6916 family protein n=1 Tax=Nioella aestuarii TaxID=1662864 RepID=UPI003D7F2103